MSEIFLLQGNQRAVVALASALQPPHRVSVFESFSQLEHRLLSRMPNACVLDAFHFSSPEPLTSLRRIRLRHPALALVVASEFGGREMDLYFLGRLKVDGVIRLEDRPSSRDILNVMDRAMAASLATSVIEGVGAGLPPLGKAAIRWTIEHAETGPQVSELAAAMAMRPRLLLREMTDLNLMSPRAFLLWGRLIRASQLLERPHETVESVAFYLGYATGGALGKALKRHVGCSPTDLLRLGGLATTLDIFRRKALRPIG